MKQIATLLLRRTPISRTLRPPVSAGVSPSSPALKDAIALKDSEELTRSWPERNTISSQWLLTLPGHNTSLTLEEFTQCVEALLCIPSTACSSRIGEKVGNTRVDIHCPRGFSSF